MGKPCWCKCCYGCCHCCSSCFKGDCGKGCIAGLSCTAIALIVILSPIEGALIIALAALALVFLIITGCCGCFCCGKMCKGSFWRGVVKHCFCCFSKNYDFKYSCCGCCCLGSCSCNCCNRKKNDDEETKDSLGVKDLEMQRGQIQQKLPVNSNSPPPQITSNTSTTISTTPTTPTIPTIINQQNNFDFPFEMPYYGYQYPSIPSYETNVYYPPQEIFKNIN